MWSSVLPRPGVPLLPFVSNVVETRCATVCFTFLDFARDERTGAAQGAGGHLYRQSEACGGTNARRSTPQCLLIEITDFWAYSARPCAENSTPMPLSFEPPNGMCGAKCVWWFIHTVPLSIRFAYS